jgi:16S rRNA (uracil1498-N3)-methyltransferase
LARRRFFVPQVRRGVAELTGEDAEHLVRVLRAEVDQVYEISDNQDLYLARITVARKSVVTFEVIEQIATPMPSVRVSLVPALFKFDRFEWMAEKATELGVDEISPFEAVRTERGLLQAAVKRRARWERIAQEASQQSRRVRLPVISEATRFENAVKVQAAAKLFLDEDPAAPNILTVLPNPLADVALLLGPEGGWTEAERQLAINSGWLACSLGPNILRAETAAIAGFAIVASWAHSHGCKI